MQKKSNLVKKAQKYTAKKRIYGQNEIKKNSKYRRKNKLFVFSKIPG